MIWLAPMAGTSECSIYFDIRDIDVRQTGNGTEGMVRGIVGDGRSEFWGEISLGESRQVNILPFWEDEGKPASFDDAVDLFLLKTQLAESVAKVFSAIGRLTAGERLSYGGRQETVADPFAATVAA
jgi:hypothetical protein